jgi:hypothetical protein
MVARPSTPYFTYGVPALLDRLHALPTRRRAPSPVAFNAATEELIQTECQIVDEWAINLFEYCHRRPHGDRRFHAMLVEARDIDPNDAYYRMGLFPTWEACVRVRQWIWFAAHLPRHD